jgi:hypothetical protein
MNEWERAAPQAIARPNEQLALYDRYGSMAYGIILQILPQPQHAQEVLVELFSSPDLQSYINYPGNIAVAIIRMARAKALEAKARLDVPLPRGAESSASAKTNLPDVVFDMAFRQGYSLDAIADRLQLPRSVVVKAIHDYSVSFRQV